MSVLALTSIFMACQEDESLETKVGSFQIYFDSKVGSKDITLREPGSTEYDFTTTNGEKFNLTKFGYYVSKVTLQGPNGEIFEDELLASAAESKGYYHILENDASSQSIKLQNVPAGNYNKITFTIGIPESGVQQGAAGGVLDPAKGAWFWNWNAGYIGFAMEGNAENSGQEYVDWGGGAETKAKTFAFHVGGWKSIDDNDKFVNNVKTISLDMDTSVEVGENLSPLAHVVVDLLKVLDGVSVDFSSTYSIHAPKAGQPFANQLPSVFSVHHVHQSSHGHN